jgi:hypothetical protein
MLFFLLLLALLAIAVGSSHARCALRFIRGAKPAGWNRMPWCWQGTDTACLRESAGGAVSPLCRDRHGAPSVGLDRRSPDGRAHPGGIQSTAYHLANQQLAASQTAARRLVACRLAAQPGDEDVATSRRNTRKRFDAGWSLTMLFNSGRRLTARTSCCRVAFAATDDVPTLVLDCR